MTALDKLLELPDGSVPSVNIANLLDSVDISERQKTLESILKKIKYEGFIELTGTDLSEVFRAAYQGYIEYEEIIELLYAGKQSVATGELVAAILTDLNFKVITHRTNHYIYHIKAQRCLIKS